MYLATVKGANENKLNSSETLAGAKTPSNPWLLGWDWSKLDLVIGNLLKVELGRGLEGSSPIWEGGRWGYRQIFIIGGQHKLVVMAISMWGYFYASWRAGWVSWEGKEEPSSSALQQNKTNTLTNSFRATRWGLDKGLRSLRSALLLPALLPYPEL